MFLEFSLDNIYKGWKSITLYNILLKEKMKFYNGVWKVLHIRATYKLRMQLR